MLVQRTVAKVIFALLFAANVPAVQAQVSAAVHNSQEPVGFADIVERVKPSVVSVSVRINVKDSRQDGLDGDFPLVPGSPFERFFRRFGMSPGGNGNGPVKGEGSGFFISADGYAVTNNHVVSGADKVEVKTDDGNTYAAKVIGTDPRTDLALIKVESAANFPFAKLSDATPRIGDWVLAVGNPFGLGGTVTGGIVSAIGRDIGSGPYDDFIQIDAAVNKGNSGGPTFNTEGEVIGVNTAIYSPSGGNVGIAFSIPASTVKTVIGQLKDRGMVRRGWIGVQVQSISPDIADSIGLKTPEGAIVAQAQPDGPVDSDILIPRLQTDLWFASAACRCGSNPAGAVWSANDYRHHRERGLCKACFQRRTDKCELVPRWGLAPALARRLGVALRLGIAHRLREHFLQIFLGLGRFASVAFLLG